MHTQGECCACDGTFDNHLYAYNYLGWVPTERGTRKARAAEHVYGLLFDVHSRLCAATVAT